MAAKKKDVLLELHKHIRIYDIRSGEDKPCALCPDELAHLEIELGSPYHKKILSILVGPSCRLGLESGLRQQRKWEIRGGKDLGSKNKVKK